MENWRTSSLQGTFGNQGGVRTQTIGVGDVIQVSIWEVSSGGLFSSPPVSGSGSTGSRATSIPEQVVGADGSVTIPYAGRIAVAGRSPHQVESLIVERLQNKVVDPQVLVTVTKNLSSTVSVLGEVTSGARIPLSVRGDRILDVVAAAGGVKSPPYETFLTLMRGQRSVRVPMQVLLTDPKENIAVAPDDVISVDKERQTFTAAGATGTNDVLPFDAIGISLEEAIAKAGGLNDLRADPGGVFVIRFEPTASYDQLGYSRPSADEAKEIPVIYRLDMRAPSAFFLAQRFPIHNKDLVFVSNAPAAELQKVGAIISTFLIPAGTSVGIVAVSKR
ncbi:polysaccharide biosynthesis/export family protein [Enhydrobacter aerosaccus]|nr:polysaccharide biosynthesis/export family protein [Enhydrobacter aerosaccus]